MTSVHDRALVKAAHVLEELYWTLRDRGQLELIASVLPEVRAAVATMPRHEEVTP